MTDLSKLTKADLTAEVLALEEELGRTRKSVPNPPARVPEADALAGCIRALDAIVPSNRYGMSDGSTEHSRILRLLAAKYKVDLIQYVPAKPFDIEGNF